jgi:hypothetical protein
MVNSVARVLLAIAILVQETTSIHAMHQQQGHNEKAVSVANNKESFTMPSCYACYID